MNCYYGLVIIPYGVMKKIKKCKNACKKVITKSTYTYKA